MAGNQIWQVLVGCGVLVSLLQWAYLAWRVRALERLLKAPGAGGTGAGDLVNGLLLAGAQLDTALREVRRTHLQVAPAGAGNDRYRLARDMAAGGASADTIAEACGMNACEAELLRVVHAARAAHASTKMPRTAEAAATPLAGHHVPAGPNSMGHLDADPDAALPDRAAVEAPRVAAAAPATAVAAMAAAAAALDEAATASAGAAPAPVAAAPVPDHVAALAGAATPPRNEGEVASTPRKRSRRRAVKPRSGASSTKRP